MSRYIYMHIENGGIRVGVEEREGVQYLYSQNDHLGNPSAISMIPLTSAEQVDYMIQLLQETKEKINPGKFYEIDFPRWYGK